VIVMEPVRQRNPENDFLGQVRQIADKCNAVLIFDEISSGWRMTIGGAYQLYGVQPDMVVYAKAMSNGFPMAAVVGKKEVMDSAQNTFISSTYWTERIGPSAALSTIQKMKEKEVPKHLCKIGLLISQNWAKLANEQGLDIQVTTGGILPVPAFDFKYGDQNLALQTLFTQEMLSRGYLAAKHVYVSYAHNEENVEKYMEKVDEVFCMIKKAIEEDEVYHLLKGPVAHTGFKRLT